MMNRDIFFYKWTEKIKASKKILEFYRGIFSQKWAKYVKYRAPSESEKGDNTWIVSSLSICIFSDYEGRIIFLNV